ncbi:MAG: M20/M25/M40 family metallo-hydrolase [Deltaproteobacteria bacterium]|nr:M20/M25/M40 family metallo-hydrolase [Deltaproteobacteria bacterium]
MPSPSPVVELLGELIRRDTHNPGGDEPALGEYLAERLRELSPDEVTLESPPRPDGNGRGAYVYARFGTPRLLLNAHLDTVPPSGPWSQDPYRATLRDGRVTGLGAADIKGAIAALLTACATTQPRDVAILFSGDEERSSSCMRAFLATPAARALERAIVCEPTNCRVGQRHRGMLSVEIRLPGVGGHSSQADRLPAPLAELCRLGADLADWGAARRHDGPPGFPGLCLNVARLDGGVAFNVIPPEGTLTVSLRPPPGVEVAGLRDELESIVRRRVAEAELTVRIDHPPLATRDLPSYRELLGPRTDAPVDLPYWTEAALLRQSGIDAVVFGPGEITQAHAADEWVTVAQLEEATHAFEKVLDATG